MSVSTYPAIRDAIATILSGVSGIGVVHTRQRWTNKTDVLKALYVKDGVLNGWTIRRTSTQVSRLPGEETRTYQFRISGFYAFNDDDVAATASEQTFQELLDRIGDAFRSNVTLNNTAALSGPVAVVTVDDRTFAGILVHYAELSLPVDEQLAID